MLLRAQLRALGVSKDEIIVISNQITNLPSETILNEWAQKLQVAADAYLIAVRDYLAAAGEHEEKMVSKCKQSIVTIEVNLPSVLQLLSKIRSASASEWIELKQRIYGLQFMPTYYFLEQKMTPISQNLLARQKELQMAVNILLKILVDSDFQISMMLKGVGNELLQVMHKASTATKKAPTERGEPRSNYATPGFWGSEE